MLQQIEGTKTKDQTGSDGREILLAKTMNKQRMKNSLSKQKNKNVASEEREKDPTERELDLFLHMLSIYQSLVPLPLANLKDVLFKTTQKLGGLLRQSLSRYMARTKFIRVSTFNLVLFIAVDQKW